MANRVVCLMGPTASGKTALAMEWVRRYPVEIISVDSAMIYRGMDVGTAKPSADELAVAPHRLIDICDPSEAYSVAQFCADAKREIADIQQQGKVPLLVGGTMMYFHALVNGLSALPEANVEVRSQLAKEAEQLGWPALHARLAECDPKAYQRLEPNDAQRIQRALEVYQLTGQAMTELWDQPASKPLAGEVVLLATAPDDRSILHQRIAQRFDNMMSQGFLDEVEVLYQRGDLHEGLPAVRCVGYRQAWQVLSGQLALEALPDKAIAATRQLAKRQLTWLRRWQDVKWLDQNSMQVDDFFT